VRRKIEYSRLSKISVHPQDTKVHFAQTVRINRQPCVDPFDVRAPSRLCPHALRGHGASE
jgi:hypothetical protein